MIIKDTIINKNNVLYVDLEEDCTLVTIYLKGNNHIIFNFKDSVECLLAINEIIGDTRFIFLKTSDIINVTELSAVKVVYNEKNFVTEIYLYWKEDYDIISTILLSNTNKEFVKALIEDINNRLNKEGN